MTTISVSITAATISNDKDSECEIFV
jgi:hypothetical protein